MTKVVAGLLLVASCAFDPTPQPMPTPTPESAIEQQFDQAIAPLLAAKCAGTGCHADFSFASIVASAALSGAEDPADSELLTKGQHAGPPWTAAEAQVVLAWLDALAAQS